MEFGQVASQLKVPAGRPCATSGDALQDEAEGQAKGSSP